MFFLASLATRPVFAEPPPAEPASESEGTGSARAQAVETFKLGMAMFRAGNLERAAELLLESHRTFPSKGNSLNAAICLERLGRYDEALALYEEAMGRFGELLDAGDRAALPPLIAKLRGKVGSLELSVNAVGAVALIAGRDRGRAPFAAPIRLTPGTHKLRIVKDGYRSFERAVEIRPGEITTLDVTLQPLESSGSLRVEDAALADASVSIDGVEVGRTPWEGTLAPGVHVVWSRKAQDGSAPTRVVVLAGQTTLLRLRSGPLGHTVSVRVRPETARIRLGEAELGTGRWSGALPAGSYSLELSEPGYVARIIDLRVTTDDPERRLDVELVVDPKHPRWPRPSIGRVVASVHGGFAIGSSMRSDAEASCPSACSENGPVLGTVLAARGGFEFPVGVALEVAAGYLTLSHTFHREIAGSAGSGATYGFDDVLRLKGFWLGGGGAYQAALGRYLGFASRATFGVLFAHSSDTITGTVTTDIDSAPVRIEGVNDRSSSTPLVLMTDLGLFARAGDWRLGGSIGLLALFGGGPTFAHGAVTPTPECMTPGSAACVADSHALDGESAYDSFVVLVPQVFVAHAF
ncbi:MAG TPA: PEGA domain-containing protein [Polyangiaceae bacterium]